MRHVFSFVLLLLAFAAPARAELDIHLYTMGLGASMWERYGHTAVRVSDGTNDVVYSFGAAPFNKPIFIWHILRGEAEFGVVAERTPTTLARYEKWDRTVWDQRLRLAPERAQWLARALAEHTRAPLNRYRYDHLYNNCATKVRDLLDQAGTGALRRAGEAHMVAHTFRDDMVSGASGHWAGHIGTDLIGGPGQDQPVPDGWVEMYLPIALRDRMAEAKLDDGSPFAEPIRELITRKAAQPNLDPVNSARVMLMILSGVVSLLGLLAVRRGASEFLRLIAQLLLGALILMFSVFGLVVVPLALVSRINMLSPNYNAFLFVPFDLVFFALTRTLLDPTLVPARALVRYLWLRATVVALVTVLSFAGALHQQNQAFAVAALAYMVALCAIGLRARRRET